MAGEASERTLEIDEASRFQRRQLRAARVAVALFLVVIALGLLGFFGSGPLNDATIGEPAAGLSVHYERTLRFKDETSIELRLSPGRGTTTVALDQSYIDGFQFGGVVPAPDRQSVGGSQLVFTYDGRRPSSVTVTLTPQGIGLHRGGASVNGHRPVSFEQLAYP